MITALMDSDETKLEVENPKVTSQVGKNADNTVKILYGKAKQDLTRIMNFINNDKQVIQKDDFSNKMQTRQSILYILNSIKKTIFYLQSYQKWKNSRTNITKLQEQFEKFSVNVTLQSHVTIYEIPEVTNNFTINFKLPKININRFHSNYKDWISFKGLYISLVNAKMRIYLIIKISIFKRFVNW